MSDAKPVTKKPSTKTKPKTELKQEEEDIFSAAPSTPQAEVKTETPSIPSETKEEEAIAEPSPTKRKVEEEEEQPKEPKKPKVVKPLVYIPFEYLTYDVLNACLRPGDLYAPPGKAGIVKLMFDYDKFAEMCPQCPPINPKKSKVLYSNHPYLKSSFGYSPFLDEENNKVSNQLRYEFDDFVTPDANKFKKHVAEHWNKFFPEFIFKNRGKLFKERYLESRCKVDKGSEITEADVRKAFKSVIREPEKAAFAEYIQFKLDTLRENAKLKIAADPYTAFLSLWSHNYYDEQGNIVGPEHPKGKRKLLAKKLTEQNSTDYDGEDANVIFAKGMYGEGIFCFEHLNFTKDALGLTLMELITVIASKEDFAQSVGQEEEECPF